MRRIKRSFIDGQYGQLHLRSTGQAQQEKASIVCLHMSPKSGRSFQDLLPYLAEGRMAIAPDYPGYGESDPPPEQPHITISDYAESIWEVVDATTTGPVVFVGYHTGSMVAVEATYQRPDDVLGVVNISAPIFTDEELKEAKKTYSPIPLDEEGTRYKVMWERIMYHRSPGMTLEMAAQSLAENLRGGENYEWGHRAAFTYAKQYETRIAEISHPVFIMNPNDDCYEQSRRVDGLLKNGSRKDFPNWGHGFLNLHPQAVAEVILDFVNSIEPNN